MPRRRIDPSPVPSRPDPRRHRGNAVGAQRSPTGVRRGQLEIIADRRTAELAKLVSDAQAHQELILRKRRAPPRLRRASHRTTTPGMEAILADVRVALRRVVRAPGFTLFAIVSLALGIGVSTAIYASG